MDRKITSEARHLSHEHSIRNLIYPLRLNKTIILLTTIWWRLKTYSPGKNCVHSLQGIHFSANKNFTLRRVAWIRHSNVQKRTFYFFIVQSIGMLVHEISSFENQATKIAGYDIRYPFSKILQGVEKTDWLIFSLTMLYSPSFRMRPIVIVQHFLGRKEGLTDGTLSPVFADTVLKSQNIDTSDNLALKFKKNVELLWKNNKLFELD